MQDERRRDALDRTDISRDPVRLRNNHHLLYLPDLVRPSLLFQPN